jgi:hypothetical protein
MTEADWLSATDPAALLAHLRRRARGWRVRLQSWLGGGERRRLERKARLFACACCHAIAPLLVDAKLTRAVEVAERFADGLAGVEELETARCVAAESVWGAAAQAATRAAWHDAWEATQAAQAAAAAVEWAADGDWRAAGAEERRRQCALLRDVFVSPFRPLRLPKQAPWRQAASVLEEAWLIYQKKRFEDLPRLAGLLEQAGCDAAALLEHCRGPRPHVRGCWALDLLLGKEGG